MKLKKLINILPSKIRILKDVSYEVLFIEQFMKDAKQVGECRPDPRQIIIRKNESDTETLKTLIHETLHAVSFEYKDLNLTETQVRILEEAIFRFVKLNNILSWIIRRL